METTIYDIIIIGAGASGLMLASLLRGKNICIIEANDKIGAKIKISGGGRCNVTNTNMDASHFLGDGRFISCVLDRFSHAELIDFFDKNSLKPTMQNKSVAGQYFFKSSNELVQFFEKSTKHADIKKSTKVSSVRKNGSFEVLTDRGVFHAKKLVVASGGVSYPLLGASSIGHDIAEYFGHTIVEPKPALVGFTVQKEQFWMKELSGISLPVSINVLDKTFEADMLFTHKGCSGPAILNASLYWSRGTISVDFLPKRELEEVLKEKNKQISTLLQLPKSFTKTFLAHIGVDDKIAAKLTKEEVQKLSIIKKYTFAPAGTFGLSKAEVSKGGVSTDQIDATTMQSKICEGLYFLGEVLDATGELGGYNFQWAFSSAFVCSKHL